jgi:hypothetical protein
MNFIIILVLKYVFYTAMLFGIGMFLHCLLDGKEDFRGCGCGV